MAVCFCVCGLVCACMHAYMRMCISVQDGVDKSLNVTRPSAGYQLYIASYLAAFGVLVYFLADNMFSNSKLSPSRIKKWSVSGG